jgi:hypothetical protein
MRSPSKAQSIKDQPKQIRQPSTDAEQTHKTKCSSKLSVVRSATERPYATTGPKQGKGAIHDEPRLVGFTYAVG